MAQTEILREFLVSLGYKVNAGQQRQFVDAVAHATLKVVELGAAIEATATGVVLGVAKMASSLEQLYFISQRTGASAEGIKSFAFALTQIGGSAAGALASIEGMAEQLRSMPGTVNILRALGVQAHDGAQAILEFVERTRSMPFYLAAAYADMLGIDRRTLLQMRNNLVELREQLTVLPRMYARAGLDMAQATKDAHRFGIEIRNFGSIFEVLADKLASVLMHDLGTDLRRLGDSILDHSDDIVRALEAAATVVLRLAEAVVWFVTRGGQAIFFLVDLWGKLDVGGKRLIETFGLMLVAWRLLNVGFLSTPLGLIFSLIAALVLLYDDYRVWKEHGKSLIDWDKWAPMIEAAWKGINKWFHDIDALVKEYLGANGWMHIFEALAIFIGVVWVGRITGAFSAVRLAAAGLLAVLRELGIIGEGGGAATILRVLGPIGAAIAAMWPRPAGEPPGTMPAIPPGVRLLPGVHAATPEEVEAERAKEHGSPGGFLWRILEGIAAPGFALESWLAGHPGGAPDPHRYEHRERPDAPDHPSPSLYRRGFHPAAYHPGGDLSPLDPMVTLFSKFFGREREMPDALGAIASVVSDILVTLEGLPDRLVNVLRAVPGIGGSIGANAIGGADFGGGVAGLAGRGVGLVGGAAISRAKEIMAMLQAGLGISAAGAAGLAGGFMQESGFNPEAFTSAGGGHGAFGLEQARGRRQERLFAFARANGLNPRDWKTQVAFAIWEAKTYFPGVVERLRHVTDPRQAAIEAYPFELGHTPGPAELDPRGPFGKRGSYAEQFYRHIAPSSGSIPGAAGLGAGSASINQTTNIHVQGVDAPHRAADLIALEQTRVHQDLLRNFRAAMT